MIVYFSCLSEKLSANSKFFWKYFCIFSVARTIKFKFADNKDFERYRVKKLFVATSSLEVKMSFSSILKWKYLHYFCSKSLKRTKASVSGILANRLFYNTRLTALH